MGINTTCYLCQSNEISVRHNRVRDSEEIQVLECVNCGLVFLSSFDHIKDGFYEESGMLAGQVDINKYRNNTFQDDIRRFNYIESSILNKDVLDFGCGGGGFLHLIKNKAARIAGLELDQSLKDVINDEGVKCYQRLEQINEKYNFVTMFHVLEHLSNPLETLEALKDCLAPNGRILIEVPNADDALLTLYNNKAFADFTYWSCHLFLYSSATLKELFRQAGFKVNYIKQVQRYPLSNHLYWLSNQLPGGHKEFNFFNSSLLDVEYENQLASIGKCDTLLAEISL